MPLVSRTLLLTPALLQRKSDGPKLGHIVAKDLVSQHESTLGTCV